MYLFVSGKQVAFYNLYSFNHMPAPFQDLDLFLILVVVHSAFVLKSKTIILEKSACVLFEDVPRPRAFSSCGRVQGFPLIFRRDRQVRNATLPILINGVNIDRAFLFSVRRETSRSRAKFIRFFTKPRCLFCIERNSRKS